MDFGGIWSRDLEEKLQGYFSSKIDATKKNNWKRLKEIIQLWKEKQNSSMNQRRPEISISANIIILMQRLLHIIILISLLIMPDGINTS